MPALADAAGAVTGRAAGGDRSWARRANRVGARWDIGEWFVVEADESDGTFLDLPVEVAVVTSVAPDHLDHWGGLDALEEAFGRFLAGAGTALVCADDPPAARIGRQVGAAT